MKNVICPLIMITYLQGMTKRGLMKHFHLAVEAVNTRLVEEFETGSDPANVARRVGEILVPAIHILQARTNKTPGGRDAILLEEVKRDTLNNRRLYLFLGEGTLVCHDRTTLTGQKERLLGDYISDSDA